MNKNSKDSTVEFILFMLMLLFIICVCISYCSQTSSASDPKAENYDGQQHIDNPQPTDGYGSGF